MMELKIVKLSNACVDDVSFVAHHQQALGEEFIQNGYLIRRVEDYDLLCHIQQYICGLTAEFLRSGDDTLQAEHLLNSIHDFVSPRDLNSLRLRIIHTLFRQGWFRPCYYQLAKGLLHQIVGSELVMQRSLGLSIQLPGDDSSLLNIHADSWSGDSPYEAVVWLPLVDCFNSKSMYIISPEKAEEVRNEFGSYALKSNQEFYDAVKSQATFINIKFGEVLIFNQNLPHGNVINEEKQSRWSLNCRFKSLFSPYADKKLGEFFQPITVAPMTQIGMDFQYPKVKIDS